MKTKHCTTQNPCRHMWHHPSSSLLKHMLSVICIQHVLSSQLNIFVRIVITMCAWAGEELVLEIVFLYRSACASDNSD